MNEQYMQLLVDNSKDKLVLSFYLAIINQAISEHRIRLPKTHTQYVYYESHHILPKSLFPDYRNCKDNLVLLLPKEHFLVHKYLTEIFPGRQMAYAFWRMCCCKKELHGVTEEDFQEARCLYAQHGSPVAGHHLSAEAREKISKKSKEFWSNGGYQHTAEQHKKGVETRKQKGTYVQTTEQKQKKSDALRGRICVNNGEINKHIWPQDLDVYLKQGWKLGSKPLSEEHKRNIGKSSKGRPSWNKGKPGTFTGRHHTEEAKEKMRAAKARRRLELNNLKNGK